MVKKSETKVSAPIPPTSSPVWDGTKSLAAFLTVKPKFNVFSVWMVGDTPLITHAWSEKAKREMLQKQVKAAKPGKDAKDPHADFVSSLYEMGDGAYGVSGDWFQKLHLERGTQGQGHCEVCDYVGALARC